MINIQVPDSSPEITLDPILRNRLSVFTFDPDRYRELLSAAGMPDGSIDTLRVDFGLGEQDWRFTSDYDSEGNVLQIGLPSAKSSDAKRKNAELTVTSMLIRSAQYMSDRIANTPDTVAYERTNQKIKAHIEHVQDGTRFVPIGSAAIGAVIGATEGIQSAPLGLIVGALAGGAAYLGARVAYGTSARIRGLEKARDVHAEALKDRQGLFLKAQGGATGAFAGMVTIEYLEHREVVDAEPQETPDADLRLQANGGTEA